MWPGRVLLPVLVVRYVSLGPAPKKGGRMMLFDSYDEEQQEKMPPAVKALYETMVVLQEESPRTRLAQLFGKDGGKQIASWTGRAVGRLFGALSAEIFLTGLMVGAEFHRRNPEGFNDDSTDSTLTDDIEAFKGAKETA